MSDASVRFHTAPEREVRACVEAFVRESPLNRLAEVDGSIIFEQPLVGFAAGDDPLFLQYKAIIGPFHLTPGEALQGALAEGSQPGPAAAGPVSVICWVLPISEATRRSNRSQVEVPSRRWSHTRTHGEAFNDALRRHLVETLQSAGYLAVAPMLSPLFRTYSEGVNSPPSSNWSERHILYAAGLGTFGLSDGLITPRGMAMRCGSVVTNLRLEPSGRSAPSHTDYCLYLSEGTCGKCIERCPAGAISRAGHDKIKCQQYAYGTLLYLVETYGVKAVGCGLCQTDVPCEERIPQKQKARA